MAGFADCRPERALLERARGGDMGAHERLYRGYATAVFTLALRILGDRAEAEEVLQDTSIEVIRHVAGCREDEAFGGWVKRIATNKCLARLRSPWHRRAWRPDGEAGERGAGGEDWLPGGPDDDGDEAGRLADRDSLERALATLPPVARAVVWLYDVEGYSHQEIASLMGRTVSFSKSRLARAHEHLRARLGPDYEDTESCMPRPNSC